MQRVVMIRRVDRLCHDMIGFGFIYFVFSFRLFSEIHPVCEQPMFGTPRLTRLVITIGGSLSTTIIFTLRRRAYKSSIGHIFFCIASKRLCRRSFLRPVLASGTSNEQVCVNSFPLSHHPHSIIQLASSPPGNELSATRLEAAQSRQVL